MLCQTAEAEPPGQVENHGDLYRRNETLPYPRSLWTERSRALTYVNRDRIVRKWLISPER